MVSMGNAFLLFILHLGNNNPAFCKQVSFGFRIEITHRFLIIPPLKQIVGNTSVSMMHHYRGRAIKLPTISSKVRRPFSVIVSSNLVLIELEKSSF